MSYQILISRFVYYVLKLNASLYCPNKTLLLILYGSVLLALMSNYL